MGFVSEDFLEEDIPPSENFGMERNASMPFLTGTIHFIEELKKRTFKSGDGILQIMSPEMLTSNYLNENGFSQPIVLNSSEGLDMMVPPVHNWSDLEQLVGADRQVEVIDVERQDPILIEFATFIRYMKKPKRHRILNLISLECSDLSLGKMIEPPLVARELDWVTKFWPQEEEVLKPKVQKYCLISPKNSYTDFHIDFGGTSVWYHIVKGEKIFYVIRPSEANNSLFWNWSDSRNRLHTFFADQVDECFKYTLKAGSTLFLPTGWIHAVLTTEDSLVYGGNFLHSLNIEEQLAVYSMETKYKTPPRYLFPHFENLHWLAAHSLLKELEMLNRQHAPAPKHLLHGLKAILINLRQWLPNPRLFFDDPNEANYFLKEISKQIRYADRLIQLVNPPKPERGSTRARKKPIHADFIDFSYCRRRAPKKQGVDNASQATDDLNSDNWRILNGGMKVVIKKLAMHDYPSTSSGFRPNFIEEPGCGYSSGMHRLMKGVEDDDDDDEEGSLQIVEYSDLESPDMPRSLNEQLTKEMLMYSTSTDSAVEKITKRKRTFPPAERYSSLEIPTTGGLSHFCGTPLELKEFDTKNDFTDNVGFTLKPTIRRKKIRPSSKQYKDYAVRTSSVVHQDDDYIYPSLELTDDENEESASLQEKGDEPWNPKAKVGVVTPRADRPMRLGKQKIAVEKGLEAAAASEHSVQKVSKVIKKKKALVKPYRITPQVKPVLQEASPSLKITNKPRKGLATAKQRLGKILKIHKMRR